MSGATPSRRSERSTRRTAKFTDDAFEALSDLDLASTSSEEDGRLQTPQAESDQYSEQRSDQAIEDDEFSAEDVLDDESSVASPSSEEDMQQSPTHLLDRRVKLPTGISGPRKRLHSSMNPPKDAVKQSSRGTEVGRLSTMRADGIKFLFGGNRADCEPLARAKEKWINEITIPSSTADLAGEGGMQESLSKADVPDAGESKAEDRQSLCEKQQICRSIGDSDKYLPKPTMVNIITGRPLSSSILLESNTSVPLRDLWPAQATVTGRKGWLLCLGQAIKTVEWAPCIPGSLQYLAICTIQPQEMSKTDTSAFRPANQTSSAIQIWSFKAAASSSPYSTMDVQSPPVQNNLICTNFGDVKDLKWCPSFGGLENDAKSTGLLATIHGDGHVRLFSVTKPDPSTTGNVNLVKPAFEAKPPGALCTSLTWLSSNTIAAACSNGCVAIWNIDEHLDNPNSANSTCPYIYEPLHNTYISKIASCYPSHPHLISTACVDGHLRLTSINDHDAEYLHSWNHGFTNTGLVWQDHLQHFLTSDGAGNLKALILRAFHRNALVMKHDASILSIASSLVHTSVLVGSADGYVYVTNPTARLLRTKRLESFAYRQAWFKHEWTRANGDPVDGDTRTVDEHHHVRLTPGSGIENMTDSFRIGDKKEASRKTGEQPSDETVPEGKYTTIYEKETHITSLAWNPNIHVGGWAAAGTRSGLLVVEDLCYDP